MCINGISLNIYTKIEPRYELEQKLVMTIVEDHTDRIVCKLTLYRFSVTIWYLKSSSMAMVLTMKWLNQNKMINKGITMKLGSYLQLKDQGWLPDQLSPGTEL